MMKFVKPRRNLQIFYENKVLRNQGEIMANAKIVENQTTQKTVVPVGGERIDVQRTETIERDYNQTNYGGATATGAAAVVKRVSWGAIFAGVVITLVTQLLLSLLGLGIGASTVNPLSEQNPASGIGTGAGIWFAVTTLVALFAGGWVAGRLAGIPRATDSLLHGLLTWGLATLLIFYLLTTTIGSLIGGTFRVLGSGLSAVTSGAIAAAPQVAGAAQNQIQQSGIDMSSIRREIETTLRQTNKPELQPGAIQNQVDQATNQTQNTAGNAASDPANSDTAVSALLNRISQSGEKTFNAADREALVNVVMARTGKSRPEAEATVASYQRTYEQAQVKYEETKAQAEQKAREVGQKTADGVSKAALWAFAALLLSALAAAIGGYLATPKNLIARRGTEAAV